MALKTITKGKYTNYVTDPGVAVFPYLNFPAKYSPTEQKSYEDPSGDFSVKMKFKESDVQDLLELLGKAHAEQVETIKKENPKISKKLTINAPFTVEEDEEGNETGYVLVKFKLTGQWKSKKTGEIVKNKVALFDSQGNPFPPKVAVWGGSVLKICFSLNPYFIPGNKSVGVSCIIRSVQVIDLVTKGEQSAESYGFEKEEGGYTYSGDVASTSEEDSDDDAKDGDDDGYGDGDF